MSETLFFDEFELVPSRRALKGPQGEISLRPKSLDVLIYLAKSAGRVVPKEELLDAVWPDVTVSDESLERCVSDIRASLSDDKRKILKTVSRRGYLFASELKAQPPAAVETVRPRTVRWRAIAVAIALLAAVAGVMLHLSGQQSHAGAPLVAILPLANAAQDGKSDYFADGLTEDLTLALSRFSSIGVVAPSSAAKFKGSAEPAAEIGRKLGARFLLTGSLRRNSDTIVLSLQLADIASSKLVWSGQYDGKQDGFLGAKAELIGKIASILDKQITEVELKRISRLPSLDMNAYDLVLQADALLRNPHASNRGETIAAARALYEKAAITDARNSKAIEGIANTYLLAWLEPSPGSVLEAEYQSPNILKWAGDYARKAVELDETSATARATLGWILNWQSGPAEGLSAFDQALQLNPGLADWRYDLLLSHGGRAKDAEVYMNNIIRLDPIHPPRYKYLLGKAYFFQGRYQEALPLIKQAAVQMPSHRPSHVLLAAVSAELGLKDELPRLVQDVFALDPAFSITKWVRYIRISDQSYAERLRGGLLLAGLPEN
jgi:adenylate cyclase